MTDDGLERTVVLFQGKVRLGLLSHRQGEVVNLVNRGANVHELILVATLSKVCVLKARRLKG